MPPETPELPKENAVAPDLAPTDYELIHLLQLAPRLSWTHASPILGATPATLAQRWQRLQSSNTAWVTCYPVADITVALVEVNAEPADLDSVIAHLCSMRAVLTVEDTVGAATIGLTVITKSLAQMREVLFDRLRAVPGLSMGRIRLATALHRHGGEWRLHALDATQLQQAQRHAPPARPHRAQRLGAHLEPLVEALMRDGRATAATLAKHLGRPETTVRRQVSEVLQSGVIAMRTEIAQLTTQWPVTATWYASIHPRNLSETLAAMSTLSEGRLCLSLAGASNLSLMVWAASLEDLLRIEVMLSTKLPHLEIHESAITLRTHKRMGWMIGPDGRRTGAFVPPETINYW
ncbi:Lrp/AsnC family transcriptional regulator [Micrococcales bacterium 31B]|nr:Lrp/AsnC family transcriptional regulator [Micrococcales bacterium 31B]